MASGVIEISRMVVSGNAPVRAPERPAEPLPLADIEELMPSEPVRPRPARVTMLRAPAAPATIAGLPVPVALERPFLTATQDRDVDPEVRSLTTALRRAVIAKRWDDASGIVDRLAAYEKRNILLDDTRDEIYLVLGEAVGRGEDADTADVFDFLTTSADEKLVKKATALREHLAYPITRLVVMARDGATEADAEALRRELAKIPPVVLRTLAMNGTRIFAVRINAFAGMEVETPPPGTNVTASNEDFENGNLAMWDPRILGAYHSRTNEANVIVHRHLLSGSHLPTRPGVPGSTAVHEVMHAFDDARGLSGSPEFIEAHKKDQHALEGHECDDIREAFAEAANKYLAGDSELRTRLPNIWRYMVSTFGPR